MQEYSKSKIYKIFCVFLYGLKLPPFPKDIPCYCSYRYQGGSMCVGRGGHGPGRHVPARGPARCPLRGPWACHGQEILFPVRTGTNPRGPARGPNAPFLCFFDPKTVKNTKIQHKTWAGPQEARARPAGMGRAMDKF